MMILSPKSTYSKIVLHVYLGLLHLNARSYSTCRLGREPLSSYWCVERKRKAKYHIVVSGQQPLAILSPVSVLLKL